MRIFKRMYEVCLRWAKHKHATYYLGIMSFAESVIFPIPVDVMLAPMCLARLEKVWHYALVATVTSVLGGVFGYFLGMFFFDSLIEPLLVKLNYMDTYGKAETWFAEYGVWVVFVVGFAPIPYKIFTISAGALNMALIPFIIASLIGRAGRFYLVAGLMKLGGEKMEKKLHEIVDILGWGLVIVAIFGYLMYKYL
ncbi:YqaA family protein [Aliikangiella coralliicola]|uniref:DedA family protein n=1 Tax=Aliikangiella coralliicola TaxID=2592383 RepID=A0A545UDB7_9GAMM|nr:YqaA family protein [Aliikangiella coralliicola]TQV87464.1 DedA family protein [Aliikangiella coralliicola]